MISYLNDKNFLKEICSKRNRAVSIKITSYNKENEVLESIEGKVSSGSINIDGSSSTRRSCSLTILTENLNIHDFYWSLTTRFSAELGLKNNTNKYVNYPIIWFPMGYYLISSFSISLSTTGASISIQGKDKMCMLNGDLGGKLTAETDFGIEDIIDPDSKELIHYNIPIKQIIKEMVHVYGQEDYSNIILNDIDDYGLNLEVYRGENPIWIAVPVDAYSDVSDLQLIINPDKKCFYSENNDHEGIAIKEIPEDELLSYDLATSEKQGTLFLLENHESAFSYYIQKISYGDTIGYLLTDLVYTGELIGKAGENITNILDKIKNMLGDFEYFYDINGNFVFQKQKAYKTNGAYQLTTDEDGIIIDYDYEDIDLTLTDLNLLTSLSNNVQINNLKNDFTVWGQKKGVSGGTVPIHMRYAIDSRPIEAYKTIPISKSQIENILNKKYPHQSKGLAPTAPNSYIFGMDRFDWRELIYQMAQDYYKLHYADEYKYWLTLHNPIFYNGKTGYEQYYTDIVGFWRQLYHPFWDDLPYNAEIKIEDWFLPDTYYTSVSCKESDPKNNTSNFYYINDEEYYNSQTPPDDETSLGHGGEKKTNPYELVTEKQKFNFTPFGDYKYLYGPLRPSGSSVTREFYGNLENIIEQNYKILMRFYFSKFIEENKSIILDLGDSIFYNQQEKETTFLQSCYLYYYDPLTCFPEVAYDKDGNIKSNWQSLVDNFTLFKQAKDIDCYHKVNIDGSVKEYYAWDSIENRTGKKVNQLNLFNMQSAWYEKVSYMDENDEEKYSFQPIGTYYPLYPDLPAQYSEQDYYNMARLMANDYLKQELKKVDPEEKLDTLKDFEKAFQKIIDKGSFTEEQKYGLIALYIGIKDCFVPLLLSFILDPDLNKNIIQSQVEINTLAASVEQDWLKELFIIELFKTGDNEDLSFIMKLFTNTTEQDYRDSEIIRLGNYSLEEVHDCIERFFYSPLTDQFKSIIKDLSGQNVYSATDISFTSEDLAILYQVFQPSMQKANQTLKIRKEIVCSRVLQSIQNDVNLIQRGFRAEWSKSLKIYLNQREYNLSKEILTDEDFEKEVYDEAVQDLDKEDIYKTEKLVSYSNLKDLSEDGTENTCYIFNGYFDLNEDKFIFISPLDYREQSNLNFIKIPTYNWSLKNRTENDQNVRLILDLAKNALEKTKKIVTWPIDFDLITYWNKNIDTNPEQLIFWFDFLDNPVSSLQKYSVKNIGQRALVKNDNQVKVIKYLPTQNIVLINNKDSNYDEEKIKIYKEFHDGYKYLYLSDLSSNTDYASIDEKNLSLSAQGKSAFVAIENLLYNNAYAQEAISINCIPQYFLQPNTKIAIYDDITKINGEYIISKISIPLSYNGTMSITAVKAVDKFERSEITNDK